MTLKVWDGAALVEPKLIVVLGEYGTMRMVNHVMASDGVSASTAWSATYETSRETTTSWQTSNETSFLTEFTTTFDRTTSKSTSKGTSRSTTVNTSRSTTTAWLATGSWSSYQFNLTTQPYYGWSYTYLTGSENWSLLWNSTTLVSATPGAPPTYHVQGGYQYQRGAQTNFGKYVYGYEVRRRTYRNTSKSTTTTWGTAKTTNWTTTWNTSFPTSVSTITNRNTADGITTTTSMQTSTTVYVRVTDQKVITEVSDVNDTSNRFWDGGKWTEE